MGAARERFTLVTALALVTAGVLGRGVAAERRQAGGPRRIVAGAVASAACVALSLLAVTVFVIGVLVWGTPVSVPPAAEVLPLPAGMTATTGGSRGGGSGSQTYCDRQILVRAAAGLTGTAAAGRLAGQLAHAEGWLLDRHKVCVSIHATRYGAVITIETSDSW